MDREPSEERVHAILHAASTVLRAPAGRELCSGAFRGYPIEVRCRYCGEHGDGTPLGVKVFGNSCGVIAVAAVQLSGHRTMSKEVVSDVTPRSVKATWIDDAILNEVDRLNLWLFTEDDGLMIHPDARRSHDPSYLLAVVELGASLLERLPQAIIAAGEGHFLALGSLRTHPEVDAHHRAATRRKVVAVAVISATLAAAVAALFLFT